MAIVSPPRGRGASRGLGGPYQPRRRGRTRYVVLGGILVFVLVVAAGLVVFASSGASLSADSQALAKVNLPIGGASVQSIEAVTGPNSRPVPVELRGQQIWPKGLIPAGETVSIQVVVKRPGWISWLSGKTQRLSLTVTAPLAQLTQHYVTVSSGPLQLQFAQPVAAISYGPSPAALTRHVLGQPTNTVNLDRSAPAGSIFARIGPTPVCLALAAAYMILVGGGALLRRLL